MNRSDIEEEKKQEEPEANPNSTREVDAARDEREVPAAKADEDSDDDVKNMF